MKRILLGIAAIPVVIVFLISIRGMYTAEKTPVQKENQESLYTIVGIVQPKETMEVIFVKHGLSKGELFEIFQSAKKSYDLSKISVGNIYSFEVDEKNGVQHMQYEIDEKSFLKIIRTPEGFNAEKVVIKYRKSIGSLFIDIEDNLIFSMPSSHKEYHRLALELSDIYAWDIDFMSDIRNGDSVKIIVEELWIGEMFKGYGNILAAEFSNNGTVYEAYRFEYDGYVGYYDSKGKSLRKTLLRSPLKFKYISSHFSRRRFHPVLRIYRPHLGVDYATPSGTPVSSAGDGKVLYSGYKGQYGKMVRIKHSGGFETYYGHLSRIPKKIRKGAKVSQGDIIGYVGATGVATGPHLDYRVKLNGRFVNPLKVRLPRSRSISKSVMSEFRKTADYMEVRLGLLTQPIFAFKEKDKKS